MPSHALHLNVAAGRLRRVAAGRLRRASRTARGVDLRIAERYLAAAARPRLHLGCGGHVLDGWLNSDLVPGSAGVLGLDVTRPFPFSAGTFAYVYSEHVIGSLSVESAAMLLGECFRVLVPGGKLRIATPDLAFLAGLCRRELSETQKRYVAWFSAETGSPGRPAGFVVNRYMGAWEQQVVYDAPMLRAALEAAGFFDVTRRGLNDSGDEALRDLANEERLPDDLLRLESLTFEGTKPNRGGERSRQASGPADDRGRASGRRDADAGSRRASPVRDAGDDAAAGDPVSRPGSSWPQRLTRRGRRLRWRASRVARRTERRLAERYFAETREPKLHLGCYEVLLDGWLNTDRSPRLAEVMRVDAARRLPFPDDTFAYVYSEYMLGSVPFPRVPAMLRECFRVLAPGGKLRIATTDLAFLASLCGPEQSALRRRYMRWASGRRLMRCPHGLCREWRRRRGAGSVRGSESEPHPVEAGVFFNHHLHADSERFVYDEPVLGGMLESAGFSHVVRRELDRSEDAALCGLANEKRMPHGFLEMECLTLEGTKRARHGAAESAGRQPATRT